VIALSQYEWELRVSALTRRQKEILDYLAGFIGEYGFSPTVREIGEAVGLYSPSSVHAQLANLEAWGLITRQGNNPRTIRLVKASA